MINERLFGSPISGKVKKKLEDRQRVAGEVAPGESIEAVFPDKNGNNQADLSSRTPFIRMWTSVKIVEPAKVAEVLEEIDNPDEVDNKTSKKFRNKKNQKKLKEIQETYPNALITKIDGKYYITTQERPQVDHARKTYIIGDYNYQTGYGELTPGEVGRFAADGTFTADIEYNEIIPTELEKNPLMKPQAGITGLTSETEGTLGVRKKTIVNFVVHNFYDFDKIYNRYFLKPGATIFVDFGHSSVKNLYNPQELITSSVPISEYLYGDPSNIVPGYDDVDGYYVEDRNEALGQVTKYQGDLEVIQGIVSDYNAKILPNGSVECSVTLISTNSALLDFKTDKSTTMHIKDILTRATLLLGLEATLNNQIQESTESYLNIQNSGIANPGELYGDATISVDEVVKELTSDAKDILLTPNSDASSETIEQYEKNLAQLAFLNFGGADLTPTDDSIRTGVFVNSREADDIYVSWGFIEDIIFNQNFGFGNGGDDINEGKNLQVRMDSSNSFTTWDNVFTNRQKTLSKVPEEPPVFLYPDWWGNSDPEDGGKGSYSYFNKKYPFVYPDGEDHTKFDAGIGSEESQGKRRIPIREVFINVETIINAFKTNETVKKSLNDILKAINEDSDGVFDWKFITGGLDSELIIIDSNRPDITQRILDSGISNSETEEPDEFANLFKFNIMSPNSIVKDYNLELNLPTGDIGNMYAIQGMSHENNIFPLNEDIHRVVQTADLDKQSLSILYEPDNGGYRSSQIDAKENKNANNIDIYAGAKSLIDSNIYKTSAIRNTQDIIVAGGEKRNPEGGLKRPPLISIPRPTKITKEQQNKLIEQNNDLLIRRGNKVAVSFKDYFKLIEIQEINLKNKSILLPYTLSLTTYGIGSIQPGDTFRVDYLPKQHFKNSYLQTIKVAHNVNSDGWFTILETKYRPIKNNTETIIKDIDREKVFLSPKVLNNLNLKGFALNGEKVKMETLLPFMTNLKIQDNNRNNIDLVFTFKASTKKTFKLDFGGVVDGYSVGHTTYGNVNGDRYIDVNGKVKDWPGNYYVEEEGVDKDYIQGVIPPIIAIENDKEYFLVIQKGFQFITDSESVITSFDKALTRSTPGKGYSA
tara:strand:- start:378 stop:3677 length:3300 start_codon:yes stop_codon:yes gene_type:complete